MAVSSDVDEFMASMPIRYAQTFERSAIEQHARAAQARGKRVVNVDFFTTPERPGTAICVVAADRPGLLAMISLALVTHGLDIIAAEVFTRHGANSNAEAVDLFWVRTQPPRQRRAVTSADVRRLQTTLTDLLQRAPQESPRQSGIDYARRPAAGTLVRFVEDTTGRFATLEIESSDRPGMLLGVCQALFTEGIQIVGSRIKTHEGRVQGRFEVVELSHQPIEEARRHVIKLAILSALDRLAKVAISLQVG